VLKICVAFRRITRQRGGKADVINLEKAVSLKNIGGNGKARRLKRLCRRLDVAAWR